MGEIHMKAIILAAGIGKRLLPLTKDIPKALLRIGDRTIIEELIAQLENCGIGDIVLVVGHGADNVKKLCQNRVRYIHNPKYDSANNIFSQWVAREEIRGFDCICMHGDILVDERILEDCINHEGDICLSVERNDKREMIRVKVKNGLITEVNKPIPFHEAYGNFIGIAKYSAGISELLVEETEKFIREGQLNAFYVFPINGLIKRGVKVYPITVNNLPWCDVDDKEDLERAKTMISCARKKPEDLEIEKSE